MRCTELTLIPLTLAITVPVQWVISPGGSANVRATTRSVTSRARGGMREGRVLSRSRPSAPHCMNRSCQRQTAVFATPAARMISAVPWPSPVMSTICARQTCFCGLLRSDTTASKRSRSAGVTSTVIPVRIPPICMARRVEESLSELFRQVLSTSTMQPCASVGASLPNRALFALLERHTRRGRCEFANLYAPTSHLPPQPHGAAACASSAAARSANAMPDTGLRSNAVLPVSASSTASRTLSSA